MRKEMSPFNPYPRERVPHRMLPSKHHTMPQRPNMHGTVRDGKGRGGATGKRYNGRKEGLEEEQLLKMQEHIQ
uniref:Uncharacterized protein n=1 Tax=Picea glauca TaxID=3330 RepID=A0A101LX24_PICGL|nr:hypothetical protein ABT39_MTgene6389 [Picea glauca]QHR86282.1 hypothetical protein Q903MT_gene281 [Picea sitchensis]